VLYGAPSYSFDAVKEPVLGALVKIGAPAIDPLIVGLRGRSSWDRARAAEALGRIGWQPGMDESGAYYWMSKGEWGTVAGMGSTALNPLIAALKDSDWDISRKAARSLGRIGDVRAVDPLIATLGSDHLCAEARDALVGIGAPAVEALIAVLKDGNWKMRDEAASLLGRIGDARAVEPLVVALEDEDKDVRRVAARALGWLGDSRAVEPLKHALPSPDGATERAAADALVAIWSPAVDPLIAALKSKHQPVRVSAAEALGKLGDVRAVAPLIAALEDGTLGLEAVEALGKLGDSRAVEPIVAVMIAAAPNAARSFWAPSEELYNANVQVFPDVQAFTSLAVAADALGRIGDARAAEPLAAQLEHPNPGVRKAAAEALGKLGGARRPTSR